VNGKGNFSDALPFHALWCGGRGGGKGIRKTYAGLKEKLVACGGKEERGVLAGIKGEFVSIVELHLVQTPKG